MDIRARHVLILGGYGLVGPPTDTSSRFLRDRQFWSAEGFIQPEKIVGWIFATEEKGARMK